VYVVEYHQTEEGQLACGHIPVMSLACSLELDQTSNLLVGCRQQMNLVLVKCQEGSYEAKVAKSVISVKKAELLPRSAKTTTHKLNCCCSYMEFNRVSNKKPLHSLSHVTLTCQGGKCLFPRMGFHQAELQDVEAPREGGYSL